MKRVPFNVSARTARLIGRENLSSAEGALIELVKNSYDADASFCIVYFKDPNSDLPRIATKEQISNIEEITRNNKIHSCYEEDIFGDLKLSNKLLNDNLTKSEQADIHTKLSSTVEIHILDDGDGMTEEVIEKSWMTIGTDNKHQNQYSSNIGRVRSGAKGIGRFALDRLGEKCTLLTKTEKSDSTLFWRVSWSDFDKQGATIDKVNAELGFSGVSLEQNFTDLLGDNRRQFPHPLTKGTHIKISIPRDIWDRGHIEKIYQELETLAPPSEAGNFSIFVFSNLNPNDFGKVSPTICEDYDYKLQARMDKTGSIHFTINRNEIDPQKISKELLDIEYFKIKKITPSQLCNTPVKYIKKFTDLLPGITEHYENPHELIGPFDLTLYFLKKQSDRKDAEIFLHRKFNSTTRKKWLENNSGIRIYRDNFRVRPYGEIDKATWDWLGLGSRAAEDPSALRTGRWKVSPGNISGTINISRLRNIHLQDKSSREGMTENNAFIIFKKLIEQIIKEFEIDRSLIYKEIYSHSINSNKTPTDEHLTPDQEDNVEDLARSIFETIKANRIQNPSDTSSKLALALLKAKARTREIDQQLDEIRRENSLLRIFASSGLTIASFTHELDGLNAKLGGRFDNLSDLIKTYFSLPPEERSTVPNYKNPFSRIDILRRDDERLKNWIKYSLRTIRKDKRNRVKINISSYLENLREEWNSTLIDRQINLKISTSSNTLSVTAYEIDLDCIFNNLIINSTEAFKRIGFRGERNITISAIRTSTSILFKYRDTGPGLSPDIKNPPDIFIATYSTKVDKHGVQIGTGLGMWLVKKTIDEYNGTISILSGESQTGFAVDMEIAV